MKSYINIFIIIIISFLINGCKKNKLNHGDYEIVVTGTKNSLTTNQSIPFGDSQELYVINSNDNEINFTYEPNGIKHQLQKKGKTVTGSIMIFGSISPNYNGSYSININGTLKIKNFRYEIEGSFAGEKREYLGPGNTNPVDNPNYYTGTFIIKHKKDSK